MIDGTLVQVEKRAEHNFHRTVSRQECLNKREITHYWQSAQEYLKPVREK
jgi:hypothetical protein